MISKSLRGKGQWGRGTLCWDNSLPFVTSHIYMKIHIAQRALHSSKTVTWNVAIWFALCFLPSTLLAQQFGGRRAGIFHWYSCWHKEERAHTYLPYMIKITESYPTNRRIMFSSYNGTSAQHTHGALLRMPSIHWRHMPTNCISWATYMFREPLKMLIT